MSSLGGFRKGEIDGKPFLIYTLFTQPDNPSSYFSFSSSSSSFSSETTINVSVEDNDLLQPQFICSTLRRKAESLKWEENGYGRDGLTFIPVSISPHFPTTRSGDQHVQDLLDPDRYYGICKLPVVPLFSCDTQKLKCNVCETSECGTNYYFCFTCDRIFHKECVESPFKITSPSYPLLFFQLSYSIELDWECVSCKNQISGFCYYCPTSKFGLHHVCAMKPIPMVIDYPKRHPHPLTFFPKQAYLPCNVCGLIIESIPAYICVPCVSVVHQDCANSPTVIKISRHHHHISFTSCLPSGEWSCGVCRKEVDNIYGAYSCNKCDGYFVHTRCALRRDLWDGKELEGVPEEPEIVVPPFEVIAEGIILHFSHGHHLKLEVSRVYDKDKFCQACVLPIYEGDYYSCMDQCDFILHEECANATGRKPHPLHAHPLTLKVVTNHYDYMGGYFRCDACLRNCCGFVYWSHTFMLDLICALVTEPFEYQGHEHPLFLALTPEEEKSTECQICESPYNGRKLNCIECDFVLCFTCATLPYKAWYKHDKHLLTFQKEKEASDESGWCESCEEKIVYSRKGGFYSCDSYCGTTLHVDCLLGKDTYMMRPGHTIMIGGKETHILHSNTMSRPLCHARRHVKDRCPYRVVFQTDNKSFCSFFSAYHP